jgi:hypothetical protein
VEIDIDNGALRLRIAVLKVRGKTFLASNLKSLFEGRSSDLFYDL